MRSGKLWTEMEPHSPRADEIAPGELRFILEHLEGVRAPHLEDHVTIQAVVEATGESLNRIADLLDQIRREDHEARLVQRLTELEKPLYAVERPSTQTAPTRVDAYFARSRPLNTILDKLPRVDRTRFKPKVLPDTQQDKVSRMVGNCILILCGVGFVVLMMKVIAGR